MYIYVHIYIHNDYYSIKSHHIRMVELTDRKKNIYSCLRDFSLFYNVNHQKLERNNMQPCINLRVHIHRDIINYTYCKNSYK